MLYINNKTIEEAKNIKYKVYSNEPLEEGVECFPTLNKCIINKDTYYITNVKAENIRCDKSNGKCRFYFTNEDLSTVADWFPAHIINVGNNFKKSKKSNIFKYAKVVDDSVGKKIDGQGCLVDVSQLPAFNVDSTNEDLDINDYKFYLTLFKDYTVQQCIYERSELYDAKLTSSKFKSKLPSLLTAAESFILLLKAPLAESSFT